MLRISIDGRAIECPEGLTVLEACRALGIDLPTLCHDDRLTGIGACRLCLVEVAGAPRAVAACTTTITDAMEIRTATPAIRELRRTILSLLAERYPREAYSAWPDKRFHEYLRAYGVSPRGDASPRPTDASHPRLVVDMRRCVSCFRCVRVCDDVQGQSVWRVWERGDRTRIRPDGPDLLHSSCVSCGACVDACPTGAIEDRNRLTAGIVERWTRTVCPYCGVGCELEIGTNAGRVVASRPVADAPVNHGHACVKGRYAIDFVHAAERVTTPRIRDRSGQWRTATWDAAIETVAAGLEQILAREGAEAIGVLSSARATNEENYLAQKFVRIVLGSNNVDCCARVCHAPSAAALKTVLGNGAATNSYDDLERARTIMVFGANPTESHPVLGARIKQAGRRGARLIVVDPRRTELAEQAEVHLAPTPGTDVPLLNALAHVIVSERLWNLEFLAGRVDGTEAFRRAIAAWPPERAARLCGVSVEAIEDAARHYASDRPSMILHGLGVTEHTQGTEAVAGLINLALLTGNIGIRGAGVNPLRGQNNVQGAAHMGCEPASLPGGVAIDDGRATCEAIWRASIPQSAGLRALDMMDAMAEGRLKGLWVIGYDILLTNPNAAHTRRALEAADLLVVQDPFFTQTASLAHVFLPAASAFEKDGTFMNAERRVQRVRRAIEPVGDARPDWRIICDVAQAMGRGDGFAYRSSADIWNEIRQVWPDGHGMTNARLDAGGLQWPCPSEDHPGTPVLYTDSFPQGRAALRCVDYHPSPEQPDDAYPLLLMTGGTLEQFNAGTMTNYLSPVPLCDVLEVAPADAERLALRTNDIARLTSRWGTASLPIAVSNRVLPGRLFATFHGSHAFVNEVTNPYRDSTGTPEYKLTAVRLEREPEPCVQTRALRLDMKMDQDRSAIRGGALSAIEDGNEAT